jgi:hypothetical protein
MALAHVYDPQIWAPPETLTADIAAVPNHPDVLRSSEMRSFLLDGIVHVVDMTHSEYPTHQVATVDSVRSFRESDGREQEAWRILGSYQHRYATGDDFYVQTDIQPESAADRHRIFSLRIPQLATRQALFAPPRSDAPSAISLAMQPVDLSPDFVAKITRQHLSAVK